MKRKPTRNIPDFSRKPKGFKPAGHNPDGLDKQSAPPPPKAVNIKPPMMPVKGQRGGGGGGGGG